MVHPEYKLSMKIKILSIVALICFLHTGNAFCISPNWKVTNLTDNKTEIEITGDCKIVVAEIVPGGLKIYGDKVNNIRYGGDSDELFRSKQVNPNRDKPGVQIIREKSRVILKLQYDQISDTKINIVLAEYKDSAAAKPNNPGYFPAKSFVISLKKGNSVVSSSETVEGVNTDIPEKTTVQNALDLHELKADIDKIKSDMERFCNEDSREDDSLPIIIVVLILVFILFMLNRRELRKLAKDYIELKKCMEKLNSNSNIPVVSQQPVLQKSFDKKSMTDDDIKKFIVEQIQSVSESQKMVQTIAQTVSDIPSVSVNNHAIDTDNVKYNPADNSFSIEQTDINIFRIYSRNEKYYYTIVDDSAVREELIGMLQMFEECIVYQTTAGVAKRVEPVSDGQLRKDGNKFYVDNNNKLVVRFI